MSPRPQGPAMWPPAPCRRASAGAGSRHVVHGGDPALFLERGDAADIRAAELEPDAQAAPVLGDEHGAAGLQRAARLDQGAGGAALGSCYHGRYALVGDGADGPSQTSMTITASPAMPTAITLGTTTAAPEA